MFEYAQSMYFQQSITPVKVTSAQRLSEGQLEKIKDSEGQADGLVQNGG